MGRLFGEYLRESRRQKGISQESLAERSWYKRTNLSAIENGKQKPSDDLLLRLAEILSVSFAELKAVKIVDGLSDEEEKALWSFLKDRHLP